MLRYFGFVLLLILPMLAHAGVNPNNGNFFITYTDIQFSDNKTRDHMLSRTYNSKSSTAGWFGFGWGSEFETRLFVMPDQTAVIMENGSGAASHYNQGSSAHTERQVAKGVAKIVVAATAKDKLAPEAADALSKKLMGDVEARITAARKYDIRSELPHKLTLKAYGSGYCAGTLLRTKGGYRRDDGCGKVDDFDPSGRLLSRTEAGSYRVSVKMENRRIAGISDTDGRSIRFDLYHSGLVKSISGSNGEVVTFTYDDNNNLILANTVGGVFYKYEYDRNHNMTRIGYMDNSSKLMTYSSNSLITSVTETDGNRTLYEYTLTPGDPNHYFTRIRSVSKEWGESSRALEFKIDSATGNTTYMADSQGDTASKATTEYDEKKRIKRRVLDSGKYIAYTYDPVSEKVASVDVNGQLTAQYRYNPSGEIAHAETSHGDSFDLEYDKDKRISRLYTTEKDGSHGDLRIKYNARGKPVEIKAEGLAPITVQYDSKGEISNVESEDGAGAALPVTRAFQNMMAIVRLAGD